MGFLDDIKAYNVIASINNLNKRLRDIENWKDIDAIPDIKESLNTATKASKDAINAANVSTNAKNIAIGIQNQVSESLTLAQSAAEQSSNALSDVKVISAQVKMFGDVFKNIAIKIRVRIYRIVSATNDLLDAIQNAAISVNTIAQQSATKIIDNVNMLRDNVSAQLSLLSSNVSIFIKSLNPIIHHANEITKNVNVDNAASMALSVGVVIYNSFWILWRAFMEGYAPMGTDMSVMGASREVFNGVWGAIKTNIDDIQRMMDDFGKDLKETFNKFELHFKNISDKFYALFTEVGGMFSDLYNEVRLLYPDVGGTLDLQWKKPIGAAPEVPEGEEELPPLKTIDWLDLSTDTCTVNINASGIQNYMELEDTGDCQSIILGVFPDKHKIVKGTLVFDLRIGYDTKVGDLYLIDRPIWQEYGKSLRSISPSVNIRFTNYGRIMMLTTGRKFEYTVPGGNAWMSDRWYRWELTFDCISATYSAKIDGKQLQSENGVTVFGFHDWYKPEALTAILFQSNASAFKNDTIEILWKGIYNYEVLS